MSKFKVGDRVVLNSGGPIMTVTKIFEKDTAGLPAGTIQVNWFVNEFDSSVCFGVFVPEALTPAT